MKRKRTTTNSLKSSSSSQQSLSTIKLIPETVATGSEFYLPEECWELICTFLGDDNDCYLEHLSLASKQFLSITNRVRDSFTISDSTLPFIPTLFQRFPNLTSLHITSFKDDLNDLLCQISKFPLEDLESLELSNLSKFPSKGLRAFSKKITTLISFTCSISGVFRNKHFILISHCFPLLEELELQTDTLPYHSIQVGVKRMLTTLPELRKIKLSGEGFLDLKYDSLLLHLCKNCEFLEEIVMLSCEYITHDGIASAICQRPTLTSLDFKWSSYKIQENISSHFIDSLVNLKGLTSITLSSTQISDELLSSIATGDLPLRKFMLKCCIGYSYAGIFTLLSKCQRIRRINLERADFLNDHHIVELSVFLAHLVHINLSQCWQLTDSTLFALVRNCPSLKSVIMGHTSIGENIEENSNSLTNFVFNHPLKYLYLASCSLLKDESLIMFASIFPNLQQLNLSNCHFISEEGICQVLRRCCKISHLNLTKCNVVKLNILNFEIPKLEVLILSDTRVDDETLHVISKNCCGLSELLLESCKSVTHKGVKHVVENCAQLREINLRNCYKVCADIVDDMVRSRPSLRKILFK